MNKGRSIISKTRESEKNPETFKFFKNTYRMYMVAEATDPKLQENFNARLAKLGVLSNNIPHITMMHIHVNADNPDHSLLIGAVGRVDHTFRRLIEKKYFQIAYDIYLKSSQSYYDIMGDFFAKIYVHDGDHTIITDFRMVLYRYLEMYLGKFTKREKIDVDGRVFFVYSYRGRELIAVPEYYHGVGVWTPHLSLVKLPVLKKQNPDLYEEFEDAKFDPQILVDAMHSVKGSMSYLNLGMQFNKLNVTAKKI